MDLGCDRIQVTVATPPQSSETTVVPIKRPDKLTTRDISAHVILTPAMREAVAKGDSKALGKAGERAALSILKNMGFEGKLEPQYHHTDAIATKDATVAAMEVKTIKDGAKVSNSNVTSHLSSSKSGLQGTQGFGEEDLGKISKSSSPKVDPEQREIGKAVFEGKMGVVGVAVFIDRDSGVANVFLDKGTGLTQVDSVTFN